MPGGPLGTSVHALHCAPAAGGGCVVSRRSRGAVDVGTRVEQITCSTLGGPPWLCVRTHKHVSLLDVAGGGGGGGDGGDGGAVAAGPRVLRVMEMALRPMHVCCSPRCQGEVAVAAEDGVVSMWDAVGGDAMVHVAVPPCAASARARWLQCEFGGHPRVLTVARANALYSMDFRCVCVCVCVCVFVCVCVCVSVHANRSACARKQLARS